MKRFLLVALAVFLLVGCSSSDDVLTGQATHGTYTAFSAPEQGFRVGNGMVLASDTVVYKTGWYSVNGSAWQQFTLSGSAYGASSSWLSGAGSVPLPASLSGPGEHYIIVYTCSYDEGWDCHGGTPGTGGWQLSVIMNQALPGSLYLVEAGVPLSDIIISPSAIPSNIYAADILQKYIYEMTGAQLPINTAPSAAYDFHVYIGQSSYTDALGITSEGCEHGGFKMISGSDYLALLGQDEVFVPRGPRTQQEFEAATGEEWQTDYYGFASGASYGIDWQDKRGSLNAVHEFLDDQGIRFYHPGWPDDHGLGTIIPPKNDIYFSPVNTLVNPDFPMRSLYLYNLFYGHISDYHYGDIADEAFAWRTSLRDNSFREFTVGSLGGPGHGLRAVTALQADTHPEFYTLNSTLQREIEVSYPNPDLCHPYDIRDAATRDAHTQYLRETFGFTPQNITFYLSYENDLFNQTVRYVKAMFDLYDVPMVSVMPNDGFSSISYQCRGQRENEKGLRGMYSNYVWEFVNNVAWEIYEDPKYAGKKISNSAYTTYLMPPDKLSKPFAPNIEVGVARWRSNDLDPEEKAYYLDLFQDWFALLASNNDLTGGVETNTLSTYDYYIWNVNYRSTRSIPCYIPHVISEDMQRLKGKSVGEFIEISTYSAWPIYNETTGISNQKWDAFASTSLDTYITAKLYWDADQDVDALLEEYYTRYYGPARDEMKALVEYVENNYGAMAAHPDFLRTVRRMANDALDTAGRETDYGKRINLLLTQINSTYTGEFQDINSCQVLSSADTIYRLTADVTSEESCFIFAANGITLDCQGHTITYSTSEIETGKWQAEYDHGIDINAFQRWLGDYFKITNCVIQDGGHKMPGNSTGAAIYLDYADLGVVENTIIDNPRGPGIEAFGTFNNTYVNNSVSSALATAFYEQMNDYAYSSESAFRDNYFHSGQGISMYFYQGHGNTFINNTMVSDTSAGLYLNLCNDNVMRDNTISGRSNGYLDAGENNDLDGSNTVVNG